MSETPQPPTDNVNTVAAAFAKLDDEQRNRFVDDTLSALINSINDPESQKRFRRIMLKIQVRKKLLDKEQQWINQLVVSFLWSVKEDFRYQMSYLIYLLFGQQAPPDLPQKIEEVRKFQWVHAGVSPEIYAALSSYTHARGFKSYDELFSHLLRLSSNAPVIEQKDAVRRKK